jgi:hypothetical protein
VYLARFCELSWCWAAKRALQCTFNILNSPSLCHDTYIVEKVLVWNNRKSLKLSKDLLRNYAADVLENLCGTAVFLGTRLRLKDQRLV